MSLFMLNISDRFSQVDTTDQLMMLHFYKHYPMTHV